TDSRGMGVGHVTTKQDDRRSPMPRDISSRSVDDVGEAYLVTEEFVDEFFAELAFHERVCGNLSNESCACSVTTGSLGEVKEPFSKRNRKCVFPIAGLVSFSIILVFFLVFNGDVGRV